MVKRTPLELAIAKQTDRRLRFEERMKEAGNKKITVWVPENMAANMRDLCRALVECEDTKEAHRLLIDVIALASLGKRS